MTPSGHCTISRATMVLRRTYKTVRQWCDELGIRLIPLGRRNRCIHYRDLDRLSEYAETITKPKPPVPVWDALAIDYQEEVRTNRDKELARRIEAASQWKKAHYGAYIGTAEMRSIEKCL